MKNPNVYRFGGKGLYLRSGHRVEEPRYSLKLEVKTLDHQLISDAPMAVHDTTLKRQTCAGRLQNI